jgi:hypothetical protein
MTVTVYPRPVCNIVCLAMVMFTLVPAFYFLVITPPHKAQHKILNARLAYFSDFAGKFAQYCKQSIFTVWKVGCRKYNTSPLPRHPEQATSHAGYVEHITHPSESGPCFIGCRQILPSISRACYTVCRKWNTSLSLSIQSMLHWMPEV